MGIIQQHFTTIISFYFFNLVKLESGALPQQKITEEIVKLSIAISCSFLNYYLYTLLFDKTILFSFEISLHHLELGLSALRSCFTAALCPVSITVSCIRVAIYANVARILKILSCGFCKCNLKKFYPINCITGQFISLVFKKILSDPLGNPYSPNKRSAMS